MAATTFPTDHNTQAVASERDLIVGGPAVANGLTRAGVPAWTFGQVVEMGDIATILSARPWGRIRVVILERDGYRCQLCGKPAITVDHIIPRSQGGSDEDWNLRAACGPCNFGKRTQTVRIRATPLRRS